MIMREDLSYKVLKISYKVTIFKIAYYSLGFPDGSEVKNLPAKQEAQAIWVLALGQKTILLRKI